MVFTVFFSQFLSTLLLFFFLRKADPLLISAHIMSDYQENSDMPYFFIWYSDYFPHFTLAVIITSLSLWPFWSGQPPCKMICYGVLLIQEWFSLCIIACCLISQILRHILRVLFLFSLLSVPLVCHAVMILIIHNSIIQYIVFLLIKIF